MRLGSLTLLAGTFVGCSIALASPNAPVSLQVTSPVSLRDCGPVTLAPCFTLSVSPVDANGSPAGTLLPPQDRLAKAVSLQTSRGTLTPFYVKATAGAGATAQPRVVLIEIDISGSMNREVAPGVSRFAAARQAISNYLVAMQDGLDDVAIVPFESHHVVPTIQSAVFTTKREQAIAQLNALPEPGPKNNTGLYQAVFTGVDALDTELTHLEKRGISRSNITTQLIVMTDGKNEVFAGDDGMLLDGPLGLEQVGAKVHDSGFDVVGIGFGNPADIDADALQKLSTRFFLASDPAQLARAFRASTPLHPSNLDIGFLAPTEDRSSLAAQDAHFVVSLHLLDGKTLVSQPVRYIPPAMSAPLYEGRLSYEALEALSKAEPPAISGWSTVLRSFVVFGGSGVVLLLLWFWVPRIVWRGEYDGLSAVRTSRHWSKESAVQASGVQVRSAPNGFEADNGSTSKQRTAAQVTQVRVRAELADPEHVEHRA